MNIQIMGLAGIPEVRPGDDLAALIAEAAQAQGVELADGDVLVVAQKVVSKAEGCLVKLAQVEPSPFALALAQEWSKDPRLVEVVLRESRRIVRMERGVLITETKHGFVCANAAVDHSNAGSGDVVTLLPPDPDRSALGIRQGLKERLGVEPAVVISDTFGRPWREGAINVAIGVAGFEPLKDYAGQTDPYGYTLRTTVIAVADELASAAELVMGKLSRIPVAVIRGPDLPQGCGSAQALVRDPEKDLFR